MHVGMHGPGLGCKGRCLHGLNDLAVETEMLQRLNLFLHRALGRGWVASSR